MSILLYVLLGLLAILAAAIALRIDDWSRDLTTNCATTDPEALDPALHPIATSHSVAEAAAAVREATGGLSQWRLLDQREENGRIALEFVRITSLFRFKDDVEVVVEDRGDHRSITAASRSRVGKGDLGQNPRNLKELLDALRRLLSR